jgi:predicted metal-dependent phosphoesterase TrpH
MIEGGLIDLHSHTTASDGQYAPKEQVALAARAGVRVLAITDHDTVDGLAEARLAADALGVRLINGIEISILHNRREVHILGHFVDTTEPRLAAHATRVKAERGDRMGQMLAALKGAGITVELAQVQAVAGDAPLGRPHLARALVELNLCRNVKEAFDRWLGDGKVAHVMRRDLSIADAVGLIHGAGGTATVAHPGSSKVNRMELEQFAAAGLDAIEVEHVDHPPSLREKLKEYAAQLKLACTAGSDFHGEQVAPNRLFGDVTMTATGLAQLEARRPAPR